MKKLRNFLKAAEIAVGTGIYLLEQSNRMAPRVRNKVADSFDDLRDRAKDAYDNISDRVSGMSLRREEPSAWWNVLRFAAGMGIGIGIGMLFAPAEGEETRSRIAERAQEIGDNVRSRFNQEAQRYNNQQGFPATGTGD